MPMVVELVVAMLGCVRIGAVHSIVVTVASAAIPEKRAWGEGDALSLTAVLSLQVSPLSLCARGSWTPSAVCSSPPVSPTSSLCLCVQPSTGSSACGDGLGPVTGGLLSGFESGDLLIRRHQRLLEGSGGCHWVASWF